MQTLENEIKGKTVTIRSVGKRGELLVKYPQLIAESLNIKPGDEFEQYFNNKGEVLFRPVEPKAVTE